MLIAKKQFTDNDFDAYHYGARHFAENHFAEKTFRRNITMLKILLRCDTRQKFRLINNESCLRETNVIDLNCLNGDLISIHFNYVLCLLYLVCLFMK